jgi:hypothetical protein
LNGNDGIPSAATMALWDRVGPDGVMVNWTQLGSHTELSGNVGWADLEQSWCYAGIQALEAIANVGSDYAARYGGVPAGGATRFLYGRSVYLGPNMAQSMLDGAKSQNPERDYTLVDPYTFGFLLRRSLGGANVARASWLDDTIAREATPGQMVSATVTVRNDGWDSWAAARCALGVVVGALAGAIPDAPQGETVIQAALPKDVAPGEQVDVPVTLTMPAELGTYALAYDLACGGSYFDSTGNIPYQDSLAIVAMLPPPDGGAGGPTTDGGAPPPPGGPNGANAEGGCGCALGGAKLPGTGAAGMAGIAFAVAARAARARRRRRARRR